MLRVLAQRPAFFRLWAAGTVSLIGDWLGFVAISRLVLERGGSALALAFVFAVHALPHACLTPLAGFIADRVDRRRIMVFVPLLQAALTFAMVFAAAQNAIVLLQALVLIRSAFTAFMVPAEAAATRHTVETSELTWANAVLSGTWSVTFVVGMALGGLIAGFGPTIALSLDAISFLLASALAFGLPSMIPQREEIKGPSTIRSLLRAIPTDLWAALSAARADKPLFQAVFSKAPVALTGGAGWLILNLVADRVHPFGAAALSLGILQAVRGSGTGVGPICFAALSQRGAKQGGLFHASALLNLLGIAIFPFAQTYPTLLLIIVFIWGFGGGGNWVLSSAALQQLAPNSMIGRLSSLDSLTQAGSMVVGAIAASLLVDRGIAMTTTALLFASLGLFFWVCLGSRR